MADTPQHTSEELHALAVTGLEEVNARSKARAAEINGNGYHAPMSKPVAPLIDPKILLNSGASDEGNAICLEHVYPGRFLYSVFFGWLAYTGTHWSMEGSEAALDRAIVDTLLKRQLATWHDSENSDTDKARKLRGFCTPNKGRVEGCKALLKSRVACSPSDFDKDPDMLNCSNGVVDLRTGAFASHDHSQRYMHCTSVDYVSMADDSQWVTWLNEAVGSQEIVDYLQLAVGYTLTGHTREECLFYLFGPPRSGKGTFTETILNVLGQPLAKEITFSTFTAERNGDSQNFDLAPLKPCRFVAASESNIYERFNEAKIKAITGGNEIYCAFKHRDHFSYRPQFTVWLSSNHPVNADPDDDAVWGRIRLVEFPTSHLGQEDKGLKFRMRSPAVMEGVLKWAVDGAVKWYALGNAGMSELAISKAAKTGQRSQIDTVSMWIDDLCTVHPGNFGIASQLYGSYSGWCRDNGAEPKRIKGFSMSLQHKGFAAERRTVAGKRCRGFVGVTV